MIRAGWKPQICDVFHGNRRDSQRHSRSGADFVFHMGMQGAAIATVIGQVASFVVSVVYFAPFQKPYGSSASAFRLNIRNLRKHCDIRFEQL